MEDKPFWVAFSHLSGIGPIRFAKILGFFGSAQTAWFAPEKDLSNCLGPNLAQKIVNQRKDIHPPSLYQRIIEQGIKVLTLEEESYPYLLQNIHHPPFLIYQRGDFDFRNHDRYVAMVGTRRVSPYGRNVSLKLARELAKEKVIVVSGLANGVDGFCHQGIIDEGGITLAVLGSGLNHIYPPNHLQMAQDIVSLGGGLISEYPPAFPPRREYFPIRNRIISGLSQALIVVEAPRKSGALITANFALEQGREVMAVPGPIFSPVSQGSNALIRQGASLVQSGVDVLEGLGFFSQCLSSPKTDQIGADLNLTSREKILLELVDFSGVTKEELLERTGWEEGEFYKILLNLELKGLVQEIAGGGVIRA
ncbi:MAG: processing protein [Candidatus Atribacteria bacterium]|nr:processing protein [Candidatus Atribacteria bacterium]